jgi:hypothetical protein
MFTRIARKKIYDFFNSVISPNLWANTWLAAMLAWSILAHHKYLLDCQT